MIILDGLRRRRWPPLTPSDDEARLMQLAHNQALDDVREALRNPTDEQVSGILARLGWAETDRTVADVRRVLAAAAGGDQ